MIMKKDKKKRFFKYWELGPHRNVNILKIKIKES